ncbi:dethiobiotin synthetase [Ruminococcus sp. YE71]|uniref:dethiobiotin synthase n=1 Tax=unclassified Ruminococcus TaxID=2608920 RepID=UPI00088DBE5F|nr:MULTISPECIES: dethiobiotin synthase [unclassified Ruminococcus]SDA26780.1 dethiobiotin synthetase [Ruminococcus sp. YE78]SFW44514.1 dethiobiotin synthetase [Ruminococcus sp. YE71]
MSKGLFITGTGTDVGKTYITGLLLKKLNESGLSPAYFKAAMSGNERDSRGDLIPGDALHVRNVSGITQPLDTMCPYVYETAVSPHLASRTEGSPVELAAVKDSFARLTEKYEYIIAEGSGGILCPLRYDDEKIFLEDVIKLLALPCIIVADAGLGMINSVVLTAAYMKSRGISVKGIILNHFHQGDVMEEDNRKMCGELTGIPVIACVGENGADLGISGEYIASLCGKENER